MKKKMPIWAKGLVILLIIAALAAAIIAVNRAEPKSEENKTANTEVPQYNVYRKAEDEVSEIRIISADNTMKFKNSDGVWQLNDIPASETDPEKTASLVTSVLTVISNNEIEKNPQDLSLYGLENPSLKIEVMTKNGETDRFIVGDKSPVTGEYFYMQEGSDTVYSIYEAKVSQMMKNEQYYQEFSRFQIRLENIDEIIMQRSGRKTIHLRVKEDLSSNTASYNVWEMTEPYDGVYNAIDQFIDDKIITPMSSLDISKVAQKRSDYGLDNPEFVLTVKSVGLDEKGNKTGEEISQVLRISRNYDSKRFVKMDGRDNIYEINSSDADFMEVDEFLVISKLAILRDIASTERVLITKGSDKTVMDISHSEDNKKFEFKINGNEADTEESKKKYQDIISVSADALYNNEPLLGGAEIVIDFKGYNGAPDMKAEFIPIDDLSYAIRRDGVITFTVKKADVNDMLERVKA